MKAFYNQHVYFLSSQLRLWLVFNFHSHFLKAPSFFSPNSVHSSPFSFGSTHLFSRLDNIPGSLAHWHLTVPCLLSSPLLSSMGLAVIWFGVWRGAEGLSVHIYHALAVSLQQCASGVRTIITDEPVSPCGPAHIKYTHRSQLQTC